MPAKTKATQPRRAVLVGGIRTPFTKAFGDMVKLDTIALGTAAVRALLDQTSVPRDEIDSISWGGVILPSAAPNVAREIAFDVGLPPSVHGMTVSRACISGLQAILSAVSEIERGDADVIIAGGSDSTSNAEIKLPQKVVHAMAPLALGKPEPADYLNALGDLWPIIDCLPTQPKIAERTTGKTMGKSCEEMAERNEITREAQDAFAVASHHRAAAAIESGRFDDEVTSVDVPGGKRIHVDGLVRGDTSLEKMARLRPVFSRNGTMTAANSSPLTDGAACVLLMSEDKARALGLQPRAAFKTWAFAGVDPADQLLMGPALAMPMALDRAGMKLSDIDLVDMHEAFAAQVLCVLKMLGSKAFAKARLGRNTAVGEIDPDCLNVHGGSVAIGHPFGATGARMATTMANELKLRDKETAILGLCAAGGMGVGAIMERVD